MAYGSIEALYTFATNQTVSVDDGGGADVATVAAGSYYPTELRAAFVTALNTATGKTFTLTGSYGSGGTGICTTLSINTGTYTLTWTSTDLRDALGFTATLTPAAASFAGTNGMKGLFLPNSAWFGSTLAPTTDGHLITDLRQSEGPDGNLTTWLGNSYRAHLNVGFSHLTKGAAIDGVDSTRISWQRFVRESLFGGLSYFPITAAGVAPYVRCYFDKDNSIKLGDASGDAIYQVTLSPSLEIARVSDVWDGRWSVSIPKLRKV